MKSTYRMKRIWPDTKDKKILLSQEPKYAIFHITDDGEEWVDTLEKKNLDPSMPVFIDEEKRKSFEKYYGKAASAAFKRKKGLEVWISKESKRYGRNRKMIYAHAVIHHMEKMKDDQVN